VRAPSGGGGSGTGEQRRRDPGAGAGRRRRVEERLGGLIYAEESPPYTIDDLFPDFREEATERPTTENYIHNVAGDQVASFDISSLHHNDTEWSDAVLRRNMDSWLAERVHEMTRETGGGLLTEVRVNGLLRENGEIVGVTTSELDPIKADLVVAADGVNSELARDAGLMDWEDPDEWFQGVKAVVEMDPEDINERFGIEGRVRPRPPLLRRPVRRRPRRRVPLHERGLAVHRHCLPPRLPSPRGRPSHTNCSTTCSPTRCWPSGSATITRNWSTLRSWSRLEEGRPPVATRGPARPGRRRRRPDAGPGTYHQG